LKLRGLRKVIIFTEALISFTMIIIVMEITESNAILAVGGAITMLLGSAIYGNVQENKNKSTNVPQP
jgi:hypothetical protein